MDYILSILGSSIMAVIVTHILGRKKAQVEIESLIVNEYKNLVDDLREEVSSLRARMDTYSQREERLNVEIAALRKENKDLRLALEKIKKQN